MGLTENRTKGEHLKAMEIWELELANENKRKILDAYDNYQSSNARNSMGCSEDWYNVYYAISRTFVKEEVEKMDNQTISYLIRLAVKLGDAFY